LAPQEIAVLYLFQLTNRYRGTVFSL